MTFSTILQTPSWVFVFAIVAGTFTLGGFASQLKGMTLAPRRLRRSRVKTPKILLFVHPRCPNTIATVRQLRNILLHDKYEVSVRMIVICPPGCSESWFETPLLEEARRIEDLEVILDYGGVLSKRYGALTSGMLLVYNERNNLVFQGGITPTLGHEGECSGKRSLEQSLTGKTPDEKHAAVFGCPLFESS